MTNEDWCTINAALALYETELEDAANEEDPAPDAEVVLERMRRTWFRVQQRAFRD